MNYAVTHFEKLETHFRACVQEISKMDISLQKSIKKVVAQPDVHEELARTSVYLDRCAANLLEMRNDVQSLKIGHPEIKKCDSQFPSCCST